MHIILPAMCRAYRESNYFFIMVTDYIKLTGNAPFIHCNKVSVLYSVNIIARCNASQWLQDRPVS